MSAALLDQIIDLADQLTLDERERLIEHLKHKDTAKTIVRLGGSWAKYQMDSDEIETVLETLRAERQASTERTLRLSKMHKIFYFPRSPLQLSKSQQCSFRYLIFLIA